MSASDSLTSFPVAAHKSKILETIANNPVTIIKAETGAGKSTQVPQYLLEAGYKVFVTVPSRAAAMTLASRVSFETNTELGTIVGYHTGFERNFSADTKILYSTEGLQIIKELIMQKDTPNRVLIIDEVQEFSLNTEALIAWAKKKMMEGWSTKVVLMSASFDGNELSKFFNDAPVIDIEGKLFPITDYKVSVNNFVLEIEKLAKSKRNVLGFVPGRREIDQTIDELIYHHVNADIFPLYADLPMEEQSKVFEPTTRTKIVIATNVAQTSITIPDIDAVVDSGLERRMMLVDGLSTLSIGNISYSDHVQRRGRAGRTKPGIYVWASNKSIDDLDKISAPDIFTAGIHQLVLRLASIGIDANEISFFHQPPQSQILDAQKTLRILGAFDKNNCITAIGETMNLFPVDVRLSRMIVEGQKYGVAEDIATIASLLTFGGVKLSNTPYSKFTYEVKSDLLAELDVFKHVKKCIDANEEALFSSSCKCTNNPFEGVSKRNYYRVAELRLKICDVLYNLYGDASSTGNRDDIIKSCVSGFLDLVYVKNEKGWYTNENDEFARKINLRSTLIPASIIVGMPQNISLMNEKGVKSTLYVLSHCTMVDERILSEVAPQLMRKEEIFQTFNPNNNTYVEKLCTFFGDAFLSAETVKITDFDKKQRILIDWLVKNTLKLPNEKECKNTVLLKMLKNNKCKLHDEESLRTWYTNCMKEKFGETIPNLTRKNTVNTLSVK